MVMSLLLATGLCVPAKVLTTFCKAYDNALFVRKTLDAVPTEILADPGELYTKRCRGEGIAGRLTKIEPA